MLTFLRCAVDDAKPYPYDAWPQTPQDSIVTESNADATVKQIEATLSPQQMQQFQQLQQQQGRHLLQGPKTQQAITTIGELNQGACRAAREHARRGFSYSPPAQLTTPSRTRTTHGRRPRKIASSPSPMPTPP